MEPSRERKRLSPQVRMVLIYGIIAALWIFLSDSLLGLLVHDPLTLARLSVLKGLVFIVVTGVLLYQLIARSVDRSDSMSRKLAQSDARFRSYVEHSPIAIFVFDSTGRCVDSNPAASSLVGREPAAMHDLSLTDIVPRDRRDTAQRDLDRLLRGGGGEFQVRRSTGETIWLQLRGVALDDAHSLVFCQDVSERRATEAAIRESENRFHTLFDNMIEGFAYCEMIYENGEPVDFRYIDVNAAFDRLTGLHGVVGRRVSEVIPGLVGEQPALFAAYARVAAGGRSEQIEVHLASLDMWLFIAAYSTERNRFIAVFDNITERKVSEKARETTLELLRICNSATTERELMSGLTVTLKRLTGCSAVGVRLHKGDDFPYYETRGFEDEFVHLESSLCSRDPNGNVILDEGGNPVLECMCGNVIQGRFDPALPFFTPNGSFWSGNTTDLLATTTEADRQARTRNRCNGEGYESVALIPLRTHGSTFGLVQFNDKRTGRFTRESIEELEHLVMYASIALAKLETERALIEASRFSQQIISGAEEGIIVFDTSLRYTLWNPFMERMTGIGSEAVIGKHPWEIFPHLQGSGIVENVRLALRGIASHGADFSFAVQGASREVWVSEASAPLRNAQGDVIGVIDTVHDITERRQAVEQLKESNEKLVQAEKMEAVGRLAGGVAHDFNNILTAIYGYCDILTGRTPEGTPERGYVMEVRKAAVRAAGLTQQLLAFSRRQTLQPRMVDLNDLLRNLHKMLGRMIGEDIAVRLDLAEGLWRVRVDPARIEQVVMNLAVNSRDAMPEGGTLTIGTGNALIDADFIRLHPDITAGEHVRIAVSDTGIGMDEETMGHLFEPFFTTKETGKGTGLGLSTAYGIVKQSGGGFTVESAPGAGTTFSIFIPRMVRAEAPVTTETAPKTVTNGRETILFVEDDDAVRSLVTLILRNAGYTVVPAANGEEALEIATTGPTRFDLLVTDVIMPGMGGRRLVDRLATAMPTLKVAYMSGYTNDFAAYQDIVSKGLELIEKPIDPPRLLARIRQILDTVPNRP